MNLLKSSSLWARHVAIDKAVFAYYDLELRFPAAARMVASGEINVAPKSDYEFKESDGFCEVFDGVFGGPALSADQQAENAAWRNHILAVFALISQIHFAAHSDQKQDGDSDSWKALRFHRDKEISTILGRGWKSFGRGFSRFWFADEELRTYVDSIIGQNRDLDKSILKEVDVVDA